VPTRWLLSLYGIGPVIASGLVSHIDIEKTPNAGSLWSFAGLVATIRWVGREEADKWVREHARDVDSIDDLLILAAAHFHKKPDILLRDATMDFKTREARPLTTQSLAASISRRPWNPALKRLSWIAADCQKKFSTSPKASLYSKLYRDYKVRAIEKNLSGGFKELAAQTLLTRNIRDQKTLEIYQKGELPPGRVDAWALRACVKILLAHTHAVLWECHFQTPAPIPYIIAKDPEMHTHYIPPPNWANGRITSEEETAPEDDD